MANTDPGTVKSATRALDILALLASQSRPMAAREIAQALSIPVSSLSYLLVTLTDQGYVVRKDRNYLPGPSLARLNPTGGETSVSDRVTPLVRAIRNDLNETTGFFIRRGFNVEVAVSEIGLQALRYSLDVGQQAPLHAFAAGKAILAALDASAVDDYLRLSVRTAVTANTVTDADALRSECARIALSGFAHTSEEYTPGIAGIARAASIDGRVVGAISIALPLVRLTPDIEGRAKQHLLRATALLDR